MAGTTARRPTKPPAPKPLPPPTDPAALLDTDIAGSGLAAANILKRAGRRLGFFTIRELLFHLPRRYDDLREMRQLGTSALEHACIAIAITRGGCDGGMECQRSGL